MSFTYKTILPVSGFLLFLLPKVVLAGLFGYQENPRENLQMFPQWLSVLERHIQQSSEKVNCDARHQDQCKFKDWLEFLESIRGLSKLEQVKRVNLYANKHKYILDIKNYNVEDYWATPKEFLNNNGDCEDYAIIKMLSLKMLGFNMKGIRLVVLQDTNLRVPHAVLALNTANDILIMDNQIDEVVSHKYILHYVPVYAVNENKWWMFLPK